MNRISIIGTGKTGSKVRELLGTELLYAFDEDHPPTPDKLRESEAVIIFVPGDAVASLLPVVLESGVPAAWGSTGFDWPEDLDERVKTAQSKWVIASNFSLGMHVVRKAIEAISKASSILQNPSYHIHEVHHIHKKDAPSGTALSWHQWLDKQAEITADREGDVKGIHELRVRTTSESILLKHEALDRALFAEGAIWTAKQLIFNQNLTSGVHTFEHLFDQIMNES
ncbi:MAG: dihydrodipicolinate reductase C-terminal domain-containing protein [Bacteroidota bacterium]